MEFGNILELNSFVINVGFLERASYSALDGGHVMFLLYEIVVGKPAPEKFVENAQVFGMIIYYLWWCMQMLMILSVYYK